MEINIYNHQRTVTLPEARLRRLIRALVPRLKIRAESLSLVFVGSKRIRNLNFRFRGIDRSTDVLSFEGSGIPGHLGDIVISLPDASKNARQDNHSIQKEIDWLILHGLLHLAGHDHATDQGQMQRLEYRLRSTLSL